MPDRVQPGLGALGVGKSAHYCNIGTSLDHHLPHHSRGEVNPVAGAMLCFIAVLFYAWG